MNSFGSIPLSSSIHASIRLFLACEQSGLRKSFVKKYGQGASIELRMRQVLILYPMILFGKTGYGATCLFVD